MKVTEFKFDNETDMEAADEILAHMRESKPAPQLQERAYVAVALGDEEAGDLQRELEQRGIHFEVALESQIPDDHFAHA